MERRLWTEGVRSWEEVRPHVSARIDRAALEEAIEASHRALLGGDAAWFARALPPRESWRVFREYWENAAYLDIETTGAIRNEDSITCVAVADRRGVRTYVRDRNLERFPESIRDASLLVTFNGSTFDFPFLEAEFPQLSLDDWAHFDLCTAFRRLGQRGGLKVIERARGLPRTEALDGVAGWIAVDLWQRHRQGDPRALPTLERYCAEDVLGLPALAAFAANEFLAQTPFVGELAPLPVPGRIESYLPFSREIVGELLTKRVGG